MCPAWWMVKMYIRTILAVSRLWFKNRKMLSVDLSQKKGAFSKKFFLWENIVRINPF